MEEGRILAGRYRLVRQLGQGGMGSVWEAVHLELGTPLALKLIEPMMAASPLAIVRFRREAQAAASLRGAHVVQVLDYGVDGETPYIAMELLDGEPLRDRLRRLGKLDAQSTVKILSQTGKAIARAHDNGIVHRDLKPENIFLARDGDDELVKVLDFGIAKATLQAADSPGSSTRAGTLLGTPFYMSPEQCVGQRNVDRRTDLWALGVIAFECLLGERPFVSDTLGSLVLVICEDPPPIPSRIGHVPAGFDAWFARSTARDLAQRFFSVREQMEELHRICQPNFTDTAFLGSLTRGDGPRPLELCKRGIPAGSPVPRAVHAGDVTQQSASLPKGGSRRQSMAPAKATKEVQVAVIGNRSKVTTDSASLRKQHLMLAGVITLSLLGGVAIAAHWVEADSGLPPPDALTYVAEPPSRAEKLTTSAVERSSSRPADRALPVSSALPAVLALNDSPELAPSASKKSTSLPPTSAQRTVAVSREISPTPSAHRHPDGLGRSTPVVVRKDPQEVRTQSLEDRLAF